MPRQGGVAVGSAAMRLNAGLGFLVPKTGAQQTLPEPSLAAWANLMFQ